MFERFFLTADFSVDQLQKYVKVCLEEVYFEGKFSPKIKIVEIDGKIYVEVASNNNSLAVFKNNKELVYAFFMGVLAVLEQ